MATHETSPAHTPGPFRVFVSPGDQLYIARVDENGSQVQHLCSLTRDDAPEENAANARLFVSGWRPAVGWVCVLGLSYTFLLKPLLPWIIAVGALIVGKQSIVPALPPVDIGELIILLGGMLGLGAMRSVDKFNSLPKTTTGG